ncbi:uncharacterized protein BX663DRAFT_491613 [Cokeromyces recurvatus]|uniref:uncharacterized protein n=1 Tax=Cokeromyces recurvatus TaxID=90255 RepID=UPI0022211DDB|nr:uncharacterized protein BX663DRAFT_491613 [Cokeromyces recurvatus]KAI7907663.1 hypothetical protein BX663DRAFT_491613 [Cokeromyces recurvatus]
MSTYESNTFQDNLRPIQLSYKSVVTNQFLRTTRKNKSKNTVAKPTMRRYSTYTIRPSSSSIHTSLPIVNSATTTLATPYTTVDNKLPNSTTPIWNNKYQSHSFESTHNSLPWLIPVLTVFSLLGVILIAICFFFLGRRKLITTRQEKDKRKQQHHESWASASTIQIIAEDEKSTIQQLPPTHDYYTSIIKQKRLTAETLVDEEQEESWMSMLKKQYAPQLALSPAFSADEFQKETYYYPSLISQNGGWMNILSTTTTDTELLSSSTKNNNNNSRPKIEIYDPQVNLHSNESEETPF